MAMTPQSNATLEQIADMLRMHDNYVVCGHVSPDGDCTGSQLALIHMLHALGKQAVGVLATPDPLDYSLAQLPDSDALVPACEYQGQNDVFIGVDVPVKERISDGAALMDAASLSIGIDHHAAPERLCDYAYIDDNAPAAALIVWELAGVLGFQKLEHVAQCCYHGLMTDTGGFRYQNASAEAFKAASAMVEAGADPSLAACIAYQSRSIESLLLEGRAIGRMEFVADGTGVVSWISQPDLDEIGARKPDVEPLVDMLRSLRGIRVACMLRVQDGVVRGSLRAKDDTNVADLARRYHGGGHDAAAGFTLHMPIEEAAQLMAQEIENLLSGEHARNETR